MHYLNCFIARVPADYRQMLGFSLTAERASRLLGVRPTIYRTGFRNSCSRVLLYSTPHGPYIASSPTR